MDRTCSPVDLAYEFSTTQLVDQFILTHDPTLIPSGWQTFTTFGWHLGVHPSQPVTVVSDPVNHISGWFIGRVIDPIKRCFLSQLPTLSPHVNPYSPVEHYIDSLPGRYVFIGFHPQQGGRIYLDSVGSLSLVYSQEQHIAASTGMLIPYLHPDDDCGELLDLINPSQQNRSFHFGLTPRHSVQRLLPNHYIDLNTWQPIRHWPLQSFTETSDTITTLNQIADYIEASIEASVSQYSHPYLSLTAGRDSRALLACARPWIQHIECFTWDAPGGMAKEDAATAQQLAYKNGFQHTLYPFIPAPETEQNLWLYRTACSAGELRGMSLTATARLLDKQQPHLSGLNAEVGRAHLYKQHHRDITPLTPERIARRVGQLIAPPFLEAAATWLEGVKHLKSSEIMDLAFIEQRLGCWVGVTGYGLAESAFRVPPFSSRTLYALMLSLPLTYRQQEAMPEDIIAMRWPELLDLPFSGKYPPPS